MILILVKLGLRLIKLCFKYTFYSILFSVVIKFVLHNKSYNFTDLNFVTNLANSFKGNFFMFDFCFPFEVDT